MPAYGRCLAAPPLCAVALIAFPKCLSTCGATACAAHPAPSLRKRSLPMRGSLARSASMNARTVPTPARARRYAVRRAARARARTLLTLGCCTGERDVRFRAALQLQPRHAMRVDAETHSFGQPTRPPYKWRRRLALRRRGFGRGTRARDLPGMAHALAARAGWTGLGRSEAFLLKALRETEHRGRDAQ